VTSRVKRTTTTDEQMDPGYRKGRDTTVQDEYQGSAGCQGVRHSGAPSMRGRVATMWPVFTCRSRFRVAWSVSHAKRSTGRCFA